MLWSSFLLKQALTGSLQNSCSKELFRKFPGRPASVYKKNSTLDASLGKYAKYAEMSGAVSFSKYN